MNESLDNLSEEEEAKQQSFLAENAEYFAQALAPLHTIFRTSGMMNVVSDEADFTVVVGMKPAGEDGVMDVDCVTLEPNQESLRDCINALFI